MSNRPFAAVLLSSLTAGLIGCDGSAKPDAAAGAGGAGGTGGAAGVVIQCKAGQPNPATGDHAVQETFQGTGQSFTDACDADSNLLTYYCATKDQGVPGEYYPVATGEVVPETVDCGGMCEQGTCLSGCPKEGALLIVTEASPQGTALKVTLKDSTNGGQYACTFQYPGIESCKPFITVGNSFESGPFVGICPAGTGSMDLYVKTAPNVTQSCAFSGCARLSP